jgi:hypothetical protein
MFDNEYEIQMLVDGAFAKIDERNKARLAKKTFAG